MRREVVPLERLLSWAFTSAWGWRGFQYYYDWLYCAHNKAIDIFW